MTRDEAERVYVEVIKTRGNPEYFIWHFVRRLDNYDLIDALLDMAIDVDEIEDEE